MNQLLERARRASRKSPRELAARLGEIARTHLERPWSRVYPHLVTARRVVKASGAASVDDMWRRQRALPFFLAPRCRESWAALFRARYPDAAAAIVVAADRVVRHEFDLLGSGFVALGAALPWHTDFKTGRTWDVAHASTLDYLDIERPSDVKVPWELSRSQHFTTLGQAYWLTGDERYAQEFVTEVSDWIARNPWAHGVNWACAMDVALRAVSWIWGFYFLADSAACARRAFRGTFLRALYLHGEYIAGHLERGDVNGNHYLSDAAGLVFLGAYFRNTPKGRHWLEIGTEIVDSEMFKQTSKDGVDFEKSTAYHRLVLELFLTSHLVLQRLGEPRPPEWVARLERMFEFVEAYTKPDGRTPLVGDADDGRVQKLGVQNVNDHRYLLSVGAVLFGRRDFKRAAAQFWDEAFWLLGPAAAETFDALETETAPVSSKAFDAGGFYALRTDRAHVFVDCGEVGMHGRGGHGHSDITSLEVWLDGMNLISDCGAYVYTASREWRNRFRSTAFHNVVQVDGEELNRLISPDHLWNLRDDARPRDVAWRWSDRADYFRGAHDGYARLDPPVLVTREVLLVKDGPDVLIRDALDGSGSRELVSRFHLDPAIDVDIDHRDVRLRTGGREAWIQMVEAVPESMVSVESGWISRSYGVRVGTSVVVITARAGLPLVATYRIGLVRLAPLQCQALLSELPARRQGSLIGA